MMPPITKNGRAQASSMNSNGSALEIENQIAAQTLHPVLPNPDKQFSAHKI